MAKGREKSVFLIHKRTHIYTKRIRTVNNNKKVISTLLAQLSRNKKPYGKLRYTNEFQQNNLKKIIIKRIILLFSFAMSARKLSQKLWKNVEKKNNSLIKYEYKNKLFSVFKLKMKNKNVNAKRLKPECLKKKCLKNFIHTLTHFKFYSLLLNFLYFLFNLNIYFSLS